MKQKNAMLVTLIDTDNAMLPIQTDILLKETEEAMAIHQRRLPVHSPDIHRNPPWSAINT